MYYDNQSFALSAQQVDDIKKHNGKPSIVQTLRNIITQRQQPVPAVPVPSVFPVLAVSSGRLSTQSAGSSERNIIGHDDIVNLKIDLATCDDSQELIQKLFG
jgi:hypothetical protein